MAQPVQELVALQGSIAEQLQKTFANYRKCPKTRLTESYVQGKISELQRLWEKYVANDQLLYISSSAEDKTTENYFTNDTYSVIEDLYSEYQAVLVEFLKSFTKTVQSGTVSKTSHSQRAPERDTSFANPDDDSDSIPESEYGVPLTTPPVAPFSNSFPIKLPRINLATFSGDYREWMSFRDLFVSLVHNNPSIPSVQKLHYLKSCLSGQALQLIRHLTTIDGNYEIAWDLVQQRYQNNRALITAELSTLMSQPGILSENTFQLRRILDTTNECLASLKGLKVDVSHWDPIVVFIIAQRLPPETRSLWEQTLSDTREYPNLDRLLTFLDGRFRALEALSGGQNQRLTRPKPMKSHEEKATRMYHVASVSKCIFCNDSHVLRLCRKFKELSPQRRNEFVSEKKLCYNCLAVSHMVHVCPSTQSCFKCLRRHNTLLHYDQVSPSSALNSYQERPASKPEIPSKLCTHFTYKPKNTLLATAMIQVKSYVGDWIPLRALLDPGSQATFITSKAVQLLKLRKSPVEVNIFGLGEIPMGQALSIVQLDLRSRHDTDTFISLHAEAMVVCNLTKILPSERVRIDHWEHVKQLTLADPQFGNPGPIDIILGVDVYSQVIEGEVIHGMPGTPVAQKTLFGYVLFGDLNNSRIQNVSASCYTISLQACCDVSSELKRFWEVEEVPKLTELSPEDALSEKIFTTTHRREDDGRYIVHLPFRPLPDHERKFGASRSMAIKRFELLERKLKGDPKLHEAYSVCMEEYLSLGHMRKLSQQELSLPAYQHCYLPHHGVIKNESATTKLRVVFDASCPTSNGFSLNDRLLTGPALQKDIFALLLEWRQKRYVFSSDMEKMFRQIKVFPEDAQYQRVVWRKSADLPLSEYCLLTVTFGTSSAPFTAIRTLHQLSQDESQTYPRAARSLLTDVYVDDVFSGANELNEAISLQEELINLLRTGKFELRKWSANHPSLLSNIPEEIRLMEPAVISVPNPFMIKTLGIYWNPSSDTFQFRLRWENSAPPYTKRKVLSSIAKLYDPLGWLAPLVIIAKIFMQRLWQSGVSWDEPLSEELSSIWTEYSTSFHLIETITIPRWIHMSSTSSVQLHGFCDASERAYAAVVYARVVTTDGTHISLLGSKTKVAPLKPITLPRLELCGAVLLSKLIHVIQKSFPLKIDKIVAWSDSTIVLSWINKPPMTFKTFVRNRVAEILSNVEAITWRYIPSRDNPADQASRGNPVRKFASDTLWFFGPTWLQRDESAWPQPKISEIARNDPEVHKSRVFHAEIVSSDIMSMLMRFSSLTRLIRVTAYIRRWIAKCKRIPNIPNSLTTAELSQSKRFWITFVQRKHFPDEIDSLTRNKSVNSKSKILSLQPFLDPNGLIRVGGRLNEASLSYNQRHPIILPHSNHFVELIITHTHLSTLHGGPSLMLSLLRQQYWIIKPRPLLKRCVHQCVKCFRQSAQPQSQLMADLPAERITVSQPFTYVGVDYTGYLNIRSWKGRNARSNKGYICVFVCFCTKAIHLEVVSEYTTSAFLAAFRRFIARRGLCRRIFSDCGTNFLGAKRELDDNQKRAIKNSFQSTADLYSNDGIEWKFIPPASPHFGGLWEAGVKSLKFHLKRVIGNAALTYEELSTLTAQIEACLNSRPICPLLDSPDDLSVLTPSHFLIGKPLLSPPEEHLLETPTNALQRWKLLQKLRQDFWHKWSSEYLTRLQQRPKWNLLSKNAKIGDVVLIKDERLPPLKWKLGRVIQTHPGKDGLVRVVTLQTQGGELQRPIAKICILPYPVPNEGTAPSLSQ